MRKHSHTTARIEKKISKTAKCLLLALWPHFKEEDCGIEGDSFCSYHGSVYHDQHVVWFGPDCWGESDYQDCWFLLYSWLIDNTTDFDGMIAAQEANDWQADVDLTPFYSPLRGASRAVIISHCRDLVRAGVVLERMRSPRRLGEIKNANVTFVSNKSQVCIYANDNKKEACVCRAASDRCADPHCGG